MEFKIVIEGVDLPEDKQKAINSSIQRAVLPHLADIQAEERPFVVIPDWLWWRGIWIGPIGDDPEGPQIQFRKHFGGESGG